MSASLWYQQQTSPFLFQQPPPNQQPADNYYEYESCTNNNLAPVTFSNMNSYSSWISDFDDFSHFYDDNVNVPNTALAENNKPTNTFHVKEKRQRRQRSTRNNDMKERNVITKIKRNTQNLSKKGQERAVDNEEGAASGRDVCVYLRAKRGQAINSHSLAERVRRQKISDKMKVLQSLVPGCDKMTGKILVLDKIIDHIHSLQDKLKYLMSQLAIVDPAININNIALELTKLQTEKCHASIAGYESIPLHGNSSAWASPPLSPWIAILEDRDYTI